jgi:hypothetical protein
MASDQRERGHHFVIASPKGVAISYFNEIAASLPATLRSRLRLTLATTSSDRHVAPLLAMTILLSPLH